MTDGGNESNERRSRSGRTYHWWLLTIPFDAWSVPAELPAGITYIKGQQEIGSETGYHHWQIVVHSKRKCGLSTIKGKFGGDRTHAERTTSAAARDYVWKEDTRVEGTQFEKGQAPIRRNNQVDWEQVWNAATQGDLDSIPAQVRLLHYRNIRSIQADFSQPVGMERSCVLFYGRTGTGKSMRAWEEAGLDAYPKDPRTKFWDGYRGQEHVVIDEFRGVIDIANLLRWLDRYPYNVEIKGSSVPSKVRKFWITSNIPIEAWYPQLDCVTLEALRRRIEVVHFQ